ncbi:hypothetical protein BJX62DRAFT_157457 [Aspergillus germanicus]
MPQVLLLTASPFLCHQDRVNGYSWAVFVAILGSQSYCQMDWTSVTAVLRLDSTSILAYTSGGGGGRIHRNHSWQSIGEREVFPESHAATLYVDSHRRYGRLLATSHVPPGFPGWVLILLQP